MRPSPSLSFYLPNVFCTSIVLMQIASPSSALREQHPPYIMRRKDSFNLTGNMVFEGFCIDLLAMIAEQLGFHYKLYLVPDGKFGAKSIKTSEWNGMVRELMDKVMLTGSGSLFPLIFRCFA